MARIAGINIPQHKHTEIGLTAIYGIGRTPAQKICNSCGIPLDKKVKDLNDADLEKLREEVGKPDHRRRPAPRDDDEHQAPDGPGLLPWRPPSPGPADARPAYPHECPYPQGSAQVGGDRQEVIRGI